MKNLDISIETQRIIVKMALLNNPLLDFKRNRQFQSLIDVLQESIPENALLQGKLSDLTSSKGSYIKQLIF